MAENTERLSVLNTWITEAEQHFNTEYKEKWEYFDNLYENIRIKKDGVADWRANISIPMVFQDIQAELPLAINGLIGGGDFFAIKPRKDDEKQTAESKALEILMKSHFQTAGLYQATHDAVLNSLKKGIGWYKLTWKFQKETVKYYDEKEGKMVEIEEDKVVYDAPLIESPEPKNVWIDKYAKTMDEARYLIESSDITVGEAELLIGNKAYNGQAELKRFIKDKRAEQKEKNEDANKRYKMYHVYEKHNVSAVIEESYLVRDTHNPYKHNMIPFFPVVKYPVPNKIIGMGVTEVLADINEMANDMENLKADNIMFSVNKVLMKRDTWNVKPTQTEFKPGLVIDMETPGQDLVPLEMGGVHSDIFTQGEILQGMASRVSGSATGITTPDPNATVNNKTATGATILAQKENERRSMYIRYNKEQAIRPLIRMFIDIIQQYQDEDRAKEIIGDKAKDLGIEGAKVDNNTEYAFIITGDEGMIDNEIALNNIYRFLDIAGVLGEAVTQIVDIPALVKHSAKKLELPEELFIQEDNTSPDGAGNIPAQPEQANNIQGQEILTVESLQPEEMQSLQMVGGKLNMTVEGLLDEVNRRTQQGEDRGAVIGELVNKAMVSSGN